ncbi:MAG: lysylphosphatidylglycerol synthase domain-containing protein, partial [Planctomycetota bacterium]
LALGAGLMLLGPVLTGARWWLLLRSQGVEIGPVRAIALTWVGLLFSLLPGGLVAGDAVKAVLAVQGSQRRAAAATSVYMDRALGLLAVLLLGTAAGLLSLKRLATLPEDKRGYAYILVVVAAAGFVIGLAGLALVFSERFGRSLIVRWLEARRQRRLLRMLHSVIMAVHSYREHRRTLLAVMVLSLATQGVIILAGAILGRALEISFPAVQPPSFALELPFYFLALSFGEIANALPFTPGGFGQLEGALELILGTFGAAKGFTLGLMWHAAGYFTFLWGALFYVGLRKQSRGPARA